MKLSIKMIPNLKRNVNPKESKEKINYMKDERESERESEREGERERERGREREREKHKNYYYF